MLIHAPLEAFLLVLDQLDQLRAALAEKTCLTVLITEDVLGEGNLGHLGQQALGRLFRL